MTQRHLKSRYLNNFDQGPRLQFHNRSKRVVEHSLLSAFASKIECKELDDLFDFIDYDLSYIAGIENILFDMDKKKHF